MFRRASSSLRPRFVHARASSTRSLGRLPNSQASIVAKPFFFNSVTGEGGGQIPAFRILDGTGVPVDGAEVPEVATLGIPLNDFSNFVCSWTRRLLENCEPRIFAAIYLGNSQSQLQLRTNAAASQSRHCSLQCTETGKNLILRAFYIL